MNKFIVLLAVIYSSGTYAYTIPSNATYCKLQIISESYPNCPGGGTNDVHVACGDYSKWVGQITSSPLATDYYERDAHYEKFFEEGFTLVDELYTPNDNLGDCVGIGGRYFIRFSRRLR